jgi:L-amino acid N-acyltransferase YncA
LAASVLAAMVTGWNWVTGSDGPIGATVTPRKRRALLPVARALGHRELVASHFVDNPASGRVLRKLGFCPTGEIRDRFSLGRGGEAPACLLSLTLGERSDCDDDLAAMRAA